MRGLAYTLLAVAVAAAAMVLLSFLLALFGDALGGPFAGREWSRLALPFGMLMLFAFGTGGALARGEAERAEFERAVRLLQKDAHKALQNAPNAAAALQDAMPAVSRFRRAAEAYGRKAPREWVDLADLIIYEDNHPEEACKFLAQLHRRLTPGKKPASAR